MTLLLWILILLAFLWIFFPMGPKARFGKYEEMMYPYSGLDPDSWKRFLVNLHEFERTLESKPLYEAVDAVKDLGQPRIADQLGYEGEIIIAGKLNGPRYLNDTLVDYPEPLDWKPYRIRNHGQ